MMMGADTLLTVGSSFPYTQFLPKLDQARAVQIDIDPGLIGMRYPNEVNAVGDAGATLRGLIPLLERKSDRAWRAGVESDVARWWKTMAMQAGLDADPINPMRLFSELSICLPADAIVTADSGSSANWYARQLRFTSGMRGSLSRRNLATMGPGVPYGIGARIGCPDRPVIVFAGDGSMQMNGLAELIPNSRPATARDWPGCDWTPRPGGRCGCGSTSTTPNLFTPATPNPPTYAGTGSASNR